MVIKSLQIKIKLMPHPKKLTAKRKRRKNLRIPRKLKKGIQKMTRRKRRPRMMKRKRIPRLMMRSKRN